MSLLLESLLLPESPATVILGSELVSDAGCTPLDVLVLAEAGCTSPGFVLVFAEDPDLLRLADYPASSLLTNLNIAPSNYR